MKKTTMVLALLAVVAMTSACFAELTVSSLKQDDPAPGLESWLVSFSGNYTAVGSINVLSLEGVHQGLLAGVATTSFLGENFFLDPTGTVLRVDTHYMFTKPALALGNAEETSDATNPAGLSVPSYVFGLGKLKGPSMGLDTVLEQGDAFLQVVLPKGAMVPINGTVVADGVEGSFSGVIGAIPEPGTVAMLIAGALGLLIVRVRRK